MSSLAQLVPTLCEVGGSIPGHARFGSESWDVVDWVSESVSEILDILGLLSQGDVVPFRRHIVIVAW